MSRHRLEPKRPRYGRVAALGASLAITLVAALGGIGLIPRTVAGDPASADQQAQAEQAPAVPGKRIAEPVLPGPPVTIAPHRPGTGRTRSEERGVGKECVSPVRYRWAPENKK